MSCFTRLSFLKGFGRNYPARPDITNCPLWVELKICEPLNDIDRVRPTAPSIKQNISEIPPNLSVWGYVNKLSFGCILLVFLSHMTEFGRKLQYRYLPPSLYSHYQRIVVCRLSAHKNLVDLLFNQRFQQIPVLERSYHKIKLFFFLLYYKESQDYMHSCDLSKKVSPWSQFFISYNLYVWSAVRLKSAPCSTSPYYKASISYFRGK